MFRVRPLAPANPGFRRCLKLELPAQRARERQAATAAAIVTGDVDPISRFISVKLAGPQKTANLAGRKRELAGGSIPGYAQQHH